MYERERQTMGGTYGESRREERGERRDRRVSQSENAVSYVCRAGGVYEVAVVEVGWEVESWPAVLSAVWAVLCIHTCIPYMLCIYYILYCIYYIAYMYMYNYTDLLIDPRSGWIQS